MVLIVLITNGGKLHVNGTSSKIKIYWYFSVDTKLSCVVGLTLPMQGREQIK